MERKATTRWRDEKIELFLLEPDLVDETYVAWLNDPLVNRYLESRFTPADIESTRQFVARALSDPATLFLGIKCNELGSHVGNIKVGPILHAHGLAEIGIMIGERRAWGRGIGSAAIQRVADLARTELGLRKLTAGCYASNFGSEKAFLKAEFVVECRRSKHYLLDGQLEDLILMARFL